MALLSRKQYFVKELRHKLRKHSEAIEVIEEVLSVCIARGWLDDAAYSAQLIAHYSARGMGKQYIQAKIYQKSGTQPDMDQEIPPTKELIAKFKTRYQNDPRRLRAALLRRGFSIDLIQRALELDQEDSGVL